MSETSTIVRPSIEEIRKLGIPCERVHSGRVLVKGGYVMHLATGGTPDIWTALGWIEGKLPETKKKMNKEKLKRQADWKATAERWGVRVAESNSVEQTIEIVKGWLEDHQHRRAMGWDT